MANRKSKGKRLEDDLREKMTLISEGCRLRGINTIDFVARCIDAHRMGLSFPSLFPDDPVERDRFLKALQSAIQESKQRKGSEHGRETA
ncbi:MAG: hypothetical protein WCJ75_14380 [Desulfomonile sp.]